MFFEIANFPYLKGKFAENVWKNKEIFNVFDNFWWLKTVYSAILLYLFLGKGKLLRFLWYS